MIELGDSIVCQANWENLADQMGRYICIWVIPANTNLCWQNFAIKNVRDMSADVILITDYVYFPNRPDISCVPIYLVSETW